LHVGVESGFAPAKKAHPALLVSDLDELKQRFSANGVAFKDDHANPEVQRICANDPWGNRQVFVEAG
jgi:hypothetical protein